MFTYNLMLCYTLCYLCVICYTSFVILLLCWSERSLTAQINRKLKNTKVLNRGHLEAYTAGWVAPEFPAHDTMKSTVEAAFQALDASKGSAWSHVYGTKQKGEFVACEDAVGVVITTLALYHCYDPIWLAKLNAMDLHRAGVLDPGGLKISRRSRLLHLGCAPASWVRSGWRCSPATWSPSRISPSALQLPDRTPLDALDWALVPVERFPPWFLVLLCSAVVGREAVYLSTDIPLPPALGGRFAAPLAAFLDPLPAGAVLTNPGVSSLRSTQSRRQTSVDGGSSGWDLSGLSWSTACCTACRTRWSSAITKRSRFTPRRTRSSDPQLEWDTMTRALPWPLLRWFASVSTGVPAWIALSGIWTNQLRRSTLTDGDGRIWRTSAEPQARTVRPNSSARSPCPATSFRSLMRCT